MMNPSFLLLALIAVVDARSSDVGRSLDRVTRYESEASSDLNAITIRSRDLLKQGYKLTLHDLEPFAVTAPNEVTTNTIPLFTRSGTGPSQKYIQLLNSVNSDIGSSTIQNYQDQVYLSPIKFGNQEFLAVIDTGSSDTWIVESGFKCNGPRKTTGTAVDCGFGSSYQRSATFSQTNERFSISYSGENVQGVMGKETVTLANITVKDQEIALVNSAVWRGDGISSGLIGLAFPSGSATWNEAKKAYSPIFTSMHRKGLVAPFFSLALNRMTEGPGVLALGGLPGAPIRYNTTFARVPMQYLTFGDADPNKKPYGDFDYRLYRLTIEGFSLAPQSSPNAINNRKAQVSVDSGTSALLLPAEVAKAFNAGWKPSASYDRMYGWQVPCTAKAPKFGIKLNGTTLWIDSEDLLTPHEPGQPGNLCASGVQQSSWPGGGMLGSVFLKSVVAVFDVGAAEMRFAQRIR